MPDHLQEIAAASTKAKQLAAQRTATQYLLHLQRDDANLHLIRPSTTPARVNNLKTTDGRSVSKAIHTNGQLHLAQFDKTASTG
jgi:hypothetical protein